MSLNPLPKMPSQAILTGMFPARFVGANVFERGTFDDPEIKEQAIAFKFDVDTDDGPVELSRSCSIKYGEKSTLSKTVKELTGVHFKRAEIFRNEDVLWDHIASLEGKHYTLMCEPSESGKYTKITAISLTNKVTGSPIPDAERKRNISAPVKTKPTTDSDGNTLDDDDIPF